MPTWARGSARTVSVTTRACSTSSPAPTSPAVPTPAIPRSWHAPSPWRGSAASRSAPIRAFPTCGASAAGACPSARGRSSASSPTRSAPPPRIAAYAGHRITYVKAHGALSNMAGTDPDIAKAIANAVRAVDGKLALLAITLTPQVEAGERAGLAVYQEVFADRGYDDDGQLIARNLDGAMLTDADAAARRVVTMVRRRRHRLRLGQAPARPRSTPCASTATRRTRWAWRSASGRRSSETGTLTLAPFAPASLAPAPADGRVMDATVDTPHFLDAGEAALVVEFGTIEDPAINDRVLAPRRGTAGRGAAAGHRRDGADLSLADDPLRPAARSSAPPWWRMWGRCEARRPPRARAPSRAWTLPACYDGPCGEDVTELGACLGLSAEAVVSRPRGVRRSGSTMYGFAPGYAYLGGTPEALKHLAPHHAAPAAFLQCAAARRRPGRDRHARDADGVVRRRAHAGAVVFAGPVPAAFFLAAGDTSALRAGRRGTPTPPWNDGVEAGEIVAREVAP